MKTKICRLHGQNDLRIEEQQVDEVGSKDVLIKMERGGICGSDLHYYQDGGFGPIRVREPIILGHEISGIVSEVGGLVTTLKIGEKVAISPSQPCFECTYCEEGNFQHCTHMRFLGSARSLPHVQGGFRGAIVVDQKQCHKIDDAVGYGEAACAEPLAVCLHARNQAGDLKGKRVLITGAGPIGALCAAVSAQAHAVDIVITDLSDFNLSIAKKMGARGTINVLKSKDGLRTEVETSGPFDVVFECSAAESAIHSAIEMIRPRGTIVQVGVAGSVAIPINALVGKEIVFKGTHRFHPEFSQAVDMINNREIDVIPLITQTYPIDDAVKAFEIAGDKSKSMKVQLQFRELK